MNIQIASRLLAAFRLALICTSPAAAEMTVGPPQNVTHHVEIQPIRVLKTNGATATTLGGAATESEIKQKIDNVWAQVGVKITWLPFADYVNDFAYDGVSEGGYNGSGNRPENHLNTMVADAPSPPKSPNAIQVNMFFVKIAPSFPPTSANTVNGVAFIDSNGIAMHVGANLLGSTGGRDAISGVIAHEIGHNLGLTHTAVGGANLMSPQRTADYLTAAQKNTIFTDNINSIDGYDFLQPYAASSNYAQWALLHGLEGGPDDDDDLDGIDNLIEFMLGLNPKGSSTLPKPVWAANGLTWTLPKNQAALDDGLAYAVETGSSLENWLPAGSNGSGSTVVQNNASSLVVRLNSGSARRFMRMNVPAPTALAPAAATFVAPGAEPGPRVISACGHEGCGIRTVHP